MITEDARVRGELLVSYQSQPLLGLLVPIELRERYTVKDLPGASADDYRPGDVQQLQAL